MFATFGSVGRLLHLVFVRVLVGDVTASVDLLEEFFGAEAMAEPDSMAPTMDLCIVL